MGMNIDEKAQFLFHFSHYLSPNYIIRPPMTKKNGFLPIYSSHFFIPHKSPALDLCLGICGRRTGSKDQKFPPLLPKRQTRSPPAAAASTEFAGSAWENLLGAIKIAESFGKTRISDSNMVFVDNHELMRFESLAGRKVAIFDDQIYAENKAGMEIARKLATQMDAQGIDDAFALFNLDTIVERFVQWREALPRIQPFYAVKCNNDPVLLRLLSDLECGFDCASRGEIDQVILGGFATGNSIIYANPCKTRAYIRHADQMGVKRMTFDSVEELAKIKECHSSPELVLRIAVADPTAQCPLATKFGCDPVNEAPLLIEAACRMGITLIGISFHVGSGCRDPSAFRLAILAARKLFQLGLSLGQPMSLLDIGGGFPGHDTPLFCEIVAVIDHSVKEYFADLPVKIIAEPGRYFASSAVSLCANVISVTKVPASRVTKREEDNRSEGQMLYVNDGVYGSFNCILFDHFQPGGSPLFEAKDNAKKLPTIVWGQTCDGLDQIEAQTKMRKIEAGDWLFYEHMGAYTSVAASHFNGFETPQPFYAISERCWNAIFGSSEEILESEL